MWLEAILSADDLRHALTELLPVTLRLGNDGGALMMGAPTDVALVPDLGLRCKCPAEVTWPLVGIHVPVKLHSVSFVLTPKIIRKDENELLVFEILLEHADVALLPDVIDNRITDVINVELRKHHAELTWDFARTLQFAVPLPEELSPPRTLSIRTHGAMLRVTEEAAVLAMSFRGTIAVPSNLTTAPKTEPVPWVDREHEREESARSVRAARRRSLRRAIGIVAAATLAVGFFVGRVSKTS
jgi:hypothetical protein